MTEGFDKSQVAGISFGGQMHGLVILDKDDHVIRPAILWNDGRTTKECEYLNNVIGKATLTKYTANIAFAGFTAPKILWVKENEPESFAKISKIMLPKDFLAYKLSGVHCTDVSDASGMLLFDVKNRQWSKEMMDICSIQEDMLAQVYESYECVGTLLKEQAEKLGLSEDVKVIISSDTFGVDENNALHSFDHADGSYHLMGCMLSAASCNKWWMDEIIGTKDYSQEQADITDDKLGNNNVFYLPYLMGERSPHNDPLARAAFWGMSMDTTRQDMTQAVLEGVAFAIRDSYEVAKSLGIHINETKLCGGGAKSPLWRKIIANVLGINVEILETEEGPALGAAMLAGVGAKEFDSVVSAAEKIVKIKEVIKPDAQITARYEEKYQKFKKLYPALKKMYNE